jgi:transposase
MHDYPKLIKESESVLLKLEQTIEKAKWRDHVRFLRHLKSGQARTTREAGELVGLGLRQSQRLWSRYKKEGIKNFGKSPLKGKPPLLGKDDISELEKRLQQSDIGTLREASQMILEKFNVRMTEQGVWFMFRRHGIKLKTGRPANIRKDPQEEAAFKKNSDK